MKPLIGAMVLGALAWIVGMFHPFDLAMPWQTGDATSVNRSMQRIMGDTDFELIEANWGRTTPFNYVASNGTFVGSGQPSEACTELRDALDAWGRVLDTKRTDNGCVHEAAGPGPMRATVTLTESGRRELRVDVRVQHTP